MALNRYTEALALAAQVTQDLQQSQSNKDSETKTPLGNLNIDLVQRMMSLVSPQDVMDSVTNMFELPRSRIASPEQQECKGYCDNPECSNYSAEVVADYKAQQYTFLLHTGLDASTDDNSRAQMSASSLVSSLTYGKSGHYMSIQETVQKYYASSDTPAFTGYFDRLTFMYDLPVPIRLMRDERQQEMGMYTHTTTSKINKEYFIQAHADGSKPEEGITVLKITPANYGDFILTIPTLDLVKPIIKDGVVVVNGKKVVADLLSSGTETLSSFRDVLRGLSDPAIPREYLPSVPDYQLTGGTNTRLLPPEELEPRPNDMTISLRGFVAIELQQGFLKGRISNILNMMEEGAKMKN